LLEIVKLLFMLCLLPIALHSHAPASPTLAASSPLSAGVHRFKVGGVELWYRVAGKTAGVPVVFLHGGLGEGSQVFQAFGGPQLEKTNRIIYFDQRGAGRSDRPKDAASYSIDILVNDVEQLRQHLGIPTGVLLGHSFGTQLSLEYAVKYPQHTAALILAAATPHLARSIDLQCERLQHEDPEAFARAVNPIGALPRCNTMAAYSGDQSKAFAMRNLFPDPATGKKVEALDNADGLCNTGEAAAALFRKGLLRYHFTDTAKVRASVLLIAGGRDFQAAIEPQRDLVKELPNALLLEYPTRVISCLSMTRGGSLAT
jgi:proline iminopeptidase